MPAQLEKYADQYFTGTQASIWVGDIWVDECFGVQLHATQSIVPIYGYSSALFDAVARGKVLIQGVFEMNFIDEGYLFSILDQKAKESNVDVVPTNITDVIKEQLDLLVELNQSTPNPSAQIRRRTRRDVMASVLIDVANLSIAQADELGSKIAAGGETPYSNVIYHMIPFNLKGYFGNPEVFGREQGAYKEIKDCFLVSNEMIVNQNDEVIKERYSFIARQHI